MISPGRSSEMSIDQLFLRYLNGRVIEEGLDGAEKCMREEDVAIVHNDKQQEKEEKQKATTVTSADFSDCPCLSSVTNASQNSHMPLNSCRVLLLPFVWSRHMYRVFGPIISYLRLRLKRSSFLLHIASATQHIANVIQKNRILSVSVRNPWGQNLILSRASNPGTAICGTPFSSICGFGECFFLFHRQGLFTP